MATLCQPRTRGLRSARTLGPRKVHKIESCGQSRTSIFRVDSRFIGRARDPALDGQAHDHVRTGRFGVHACGANLSTSLNLTK